MYIHSHTVYFTQIKNKIKLKQKINQTCDVKHKWKVVYVQTQQ